MTDPWAAPPTGEVTPAASVAHAVQDAMESSLEKAAHTIKHLGEVISALLNATHAPKQVKDLLHQVGAVVENVTRALSDAIGALLGGGDSHHGPDGQMLHQVGAIPPRPVEQGGQRFGSKALAEN